MVREFIKPGANMMVIFEPVFPLNSSCKTHCEKSGLHVIRVNSKNNFFISGGAIKLVYTII